MPRKFTTILFLGLLAGEAIAQTVAGVIRGSVIDGGGRCGVIAHGLDGMSHHRESAPQALPYVVLRGPTGYTIGGKHLWATGYCPRSIRRGVNMNGAPSKSPESRRNRKRPTAVCPKFC